MARKLTHGARKHVVVVASGAKLSIVGLNAAFRQTANKLPEVANAEECKDGVFGNKVGNCRCSQTLSLFSAVGDPPAGIEYFCSAHLVVMPFVGHPILSR